MDRVIFNAYNSYSSCTSNCNERLDLKIKKYRLKNLNKCNEYYKRSYYNLKLHLRYIILL